jgi:co-chaperonin GroES (HSP10)
MKAKTKLNYNGITVKDNFEILGDRYAVEIMEVDDLLIGDILIPDKGEVERKWQAGEIVAVGNGHRLETDVTVPMFFEKGDVVVFERLTGKDFFFGHGEYRIMSQIDVLARINT